MSPHVYGEAFCSATTVAENNVRRAATANRLLHYASFYPPPPNLPAHSVGYARVSSVGQNLDSQVDAWKEPGAAKPSPTR